MVTDDENETELDTITSNFASYLALDTDEEFPPESPEEAEINKQLEFVYLPSKSDEKAKLLEKHGIIENWSNSRTISSMGSVIWIFDMTDEAVSEFVKAKESLKEEDL